MKKANVVRRILYLATILILFNSCEFDYTVERESDDFKPRVVVNSIFSPNSEDRIDIFFSWSKYLTQDFEGPPPAGSVELYEDNILIDQAEIDQQGAIYFYYPLKSGKTYKFVATIDNYGVVEGESMIPYPAESVDGKFNYIFDDIDETPFFLENQEIAICGVTLYEIVSKEKARAMWLRMKGGYAYKTNYEEGIYLSNFDYNMPKNIYTNSVYIDTFNLKLENGTQPSDGYSLYYGGVRYHNGTARIPYSLLSQINPLDLSYAFEDKRFIYAPTGPMPWESEKVEVQLSHVSVEVITPSDDYDRYTKSLYKYTELSFDPDFPMFSDVVYVHTNIKNGLGVFAGYNSTHLNIPIKREK